MRKFLSSAGLCIVLFVFVSCATTKGIQTGAAKYGTIKYNQKKFDAAFEKKNYSTCIAMLHDKNKDGKDIRDNLDEAMLCYMLNDYESSSEIFELTDSLMQEAFTKSISKTMGATLFNDNIAEYPGNVYEYLFVNSFNALNYIHMGDLENALVELNKAAVKENEYLSKYGDFALADAVSSDEKSEMEKSAGKLGLNLSEYKADSPKKPTMADLYRDSAFLRYLSLVLYSAAGNRSSVEVDAKVLATLGSNINVSEDVNIPAGKGRLGVLALSGLIGRRHEAKFETPQVLPFYVPIDGAKPILFKLKFVWPEYSGQDPQITDIEIELKDVGKKSAVVIEDFDEALAKDVRLKANRAFNRSMIRSISKKTAGLASAQATLISARKIADEAKGSIAGVAAEATYVAAWHTAEYAVDQLDKTEFADLRQGFYLPRSVSAAGFTVDPGTYSGKVTFYKDKTKVGEQSFSNVTVSANRPTLVVTSCFK